MPRSSSPSASWTGGLWRYGLVGAVSTAAHYLVLAVCVEGRWLPAFLASGLGAVVGAQVAYLGNRVFTFRHRGAVVASWARFQATALAGALASMGIVGAGVALGVHYLLAQAVATVGVMLLTYQVNRRWSFGAPDALGASQRRDGSST